MRLGNRDDSERFVSLVHRREHEGALGVPDNALRPIRNKFDFANFLAGLPIDYPELVGKATGLQIEKVVAGFVENKNRVLIHFFALSLVCLSCSLLTTYTLP